MELNIYCKAKSKLIFMMMHLGFYLFFKVETLSQLLLLPFKNQLKHLFSVLNSWFSQATENQRPFPIKVPFNGAYRQTFPMFYNRF